MNNEIKLYEAVSVGKELPQGPEERYVTIDADGVLDIDELPFFGHTVKWLKPLPNHVPISRERLEAYEKLKEATDNLIYTASKLWDEVKPIKDSGAMTVTHPMIEEAKFALSNLNTINEAVF